MAPFAFLPGIPAEREGDAHPMFEAQPVPIRVNGWMQRETQEGRECMGGGGPIRQQQLVKRNHHFAFFPVAQDTGSLAKLSGTQRASTAVHGPLGQNSVKPPSHRAPFAPGDYIKRRPTRKVSSGKVQSIKRDEIQLS